MRVVGGLYRHRQLLFSSNEITRPTKDMVKEGLFSALGEKIHNSLVLDLFAGCGSLGIEAISRGANYAYFVDINKEAIILIRKNLNNLNIKNADVNMMSYLDALKFYRNKNLKFDIVFLDPPYKNDCYNTIIEFLKTENLLNKNACIVLESDKEINVSLTCQKIKDYKYGKTRIKILWL